MKAKLILENGRKIEVELTEEQMKQIHNETKWPQVGDWYWYVGTYGPTTITEHNDHPVDYGRINLGNAFHTKQESENIDWTED